MGKVCDFRSNSSRTCSLIYQDIASFDVFMDDSPMGHYPRSLAHVHDFWCPPP